MSRAIVIGSGFGGLAAALRAQALGYETTVLERLDQPGGRAGVVKRNGYTFDLGPTIITAPFLIDELFRIHDRQRSDYVELRKLDPWYQIRYPDGQTLPFSDDLNLMKQNLNKFSPAASEQYQQYLDDTETVFEVGFEQLATEPFDSLWSMIRAIPDLVSNRAYQSVYKSVSNYFDSNYLRQAFSFHPLLIGGNPLTASSIYRLIHVLERKWGVRYAMGGTNRIVASLVSLLEETGGSIEYNSTIEEIIVEDDTAVGVKDQAGQIREADLVISNADPIQLYKHMLPDSCSPSGLRDLDHYEQSMGLFVLYFGTNCQYDDIYHHEILLSDHYQDVLRDIFDRQVIPDELSMYLHRPTATDDDLAPDGHDTMYVLVPVPNLRGGQNWDETGPKLRDRVVEELERRVCPGLSESITTSFYRTPDEFKNDYLSEAGSGFSIQPNLTQSAWFRFHNNAPLENLYLVGAGTHPGAGVPGVLCSAKVMQNSLQNG